MSNRRPFDSAPVAPLASLRVLPQSPAARQGVSPAQLWAVFRAHQRWAAIAAAIVLALGMLVVGLLPRSYSAVATLMVDYDLSNPVDGSELPVDQVSSYLATQIELMRRPELLAQVAAALPPEDLAAFQRGYQAKFGPPDQWVAAQLAKKLEVLPGQSGSHLIWIEFTASNARRAAAVANGLVDVYLAEERRREAGLPQVVETSNDARLKELTDRVNEARRKVDDYQKEHGQLAGAGNAEVEKQLLGDLQSRLLDARARRIAIETRLGSSASTAEEQGAVARMQDEARADLGAKQRRVAELTRQFGDNYPGLQQARQDVEDLKARLAELTATGSRNADLQLSQARRLEATLQGQVDAQQARIAALGRATDDASRYALELESAEKAYRDALTHSYQTESWLNRADTANVHVASRASVPMTARSPKTWLLVVLVLAASVAIGALLPFALELRSRKLRHSDDLERSLGLPVLATLERIEPRVAGRLS